MRGAVADLDSPHPVGLQLPAVYQDDEFLDRFLVAFDVALAPVFSTLDNLHCYVDPRLAPDDFVEWLASWVGVAPDGTPSAARPEMVARAITLHRRRGTIRGLKDVVQLTFGGSVEVEESGGAAWSIDPGGNLPGHPEARLHVRLSVADPSAVDLRHLNSVVAAAKPVNMPHAVEVVAS